MNSKVLHSLSAITLLLSGLSGTTILANGASSAESPPPGHLGCAIAQGTGMNALSKAEILISKENPSFGENSPFQVQFGNLTVKVSGHMEGNGKLLVDVNVLKGTKLIRNIFSDKIDTTYNGPSDFFSWEYDEAENNFSVICGYLSE
jgi:hypothetical protein